MKAFENRLWLSSPTMHGDEQRYVKEAFDTNWVSTVGENIDKLELSVCEYLKGGYPEASGGGAGTDKEKTAPLYAAALSSGTAALHMAVKLAGVKAGDRVFCSDMTFSASVNPVLYEKAEPVFIDSEYGTWNMDPEALEAAFAKYPDAKAVIAVNLYGTPARLDEINAICDRHGAVLIEDAAESLGAVYKGRRTGTFGRFNAVSFNGNKIITTSGGGMLITGSHYAAGLARKWSAQSREPAPWYQHEETGYNYRMSNILAGIGRGQLLHLGEHIARKKAVYERYREGFKNLPAAMNPYIEEAMEPNFWLSCLVIDEAAMSRQVRSDREALYIKEENRSCPTEILETLAKYNAEGRPIWKPMHMQPVFAGCDFITASRYEDETADGGRKRAHGVSGDIFARGLCLPSDIKMTEEEQDMVIEIVKSCFSAC